MKKILSLASALLLVIAFAGGTSVNIALASDAFTYSFGPGATDNTTGGEVTKLQKFLAKDKAIYPEQTATGEFDMPTMRALQRWQAKYGIISAGTPDTTGYGRVGARTRALLNTQFGVSVAGAIVLTRNFGLGASDSGTGGEVTKLQQILAQDKVIYPTGLITGYFGPATERAVKAWQAKQGIVSGGTPESTGYGRIGAKTRESLNAYAQSTMKKPISATAKPITGGAVNTGALSVKASRDLVSTYDLVKSAVLTNTLSSSFIGTGNGLPVTFTQSGVPAGITVPKTLSCTTPCSVENKVTIAPKLPVGAYPITVTAVAGNEKAEGTYTITIGSPTAFSFSVVPSGTITVKKSLSGSVTGSNSITLRTETGEPQAVFLTQTTGEKNIQLKDLGNCVPPCSKVNSVTVGYDVLSGTYPVTVTGKSADGISRSASYNVIVEYNEKFGYHISNQDDPDRSITMTVPVGQSVTSYIPLKFIMDGGSPSFASVKQTGTSPIGVSASLSGCMLPCSPTLAVTLSPSVKVGTPTVTFSVSANYVDPLDGKTKTLTRTYSEKIVVVTGNSGAVN